MQSAYVVPDGRHEVADRDTLCEEWNIVQAETAAVRPGVEMLPVLACRIGNVVPLYVAPYFYRSGHCLVCHSSRSTWAWRLVVLGSRAQTTSVNLMGRGLEMKDDACAFDHGSNVAQKLQSGLIGRIPERDRDLGCPATCIRVL